MTARNEYWRQAMSAELKTKRIAVLAADGFEQSELLEPVRALQDAGATVEIVSLSEGEIRGWNKTDWGEKVKVDRSLDDTAATEYDGLVVPGGQINPDLLRADPRAVQFVRDFHESSKPIAAICHGPWLLVEAGIAAGHKMTSYKSIKTDLKNAGADWVDAEVVVDQGIVTSRAPGDLPVFCATVVNAMAEAPRGDAPGAGAGRAAPG
jgi:protease I